MWGSVARVLWQGPHHRSVVFRPVLVKASSSFCCPRVPTFIPDSTLFRGSGSGPIRLCRGSVCGKREGRCEARAKMG